MKNTVRYITAVTGVILIIGLILAVSGGIAPRATGKGIHPSQVATIKMGGYAYENERALEEDDFNLRVDENGEVYQQKDENHADQVPNTFGSETFIRLCNQYYNETEELYYIPVGPNPDGTILPCMAFHTKPSEGSLLKYVSQINYLGSSNQLAYFSYHSNPGPKTSRIGQRFSSKVGPNGEITIDFFSDKIKALLLYPQMKNSPLLVDIDGDGFFEYDPSKTFGSKAVPIEPTIFN